MVRSRKNRGKSGGNDRLLQGLYISNPFQSDIENITEHYKAIIRNGISVQGPVNVSPLSRITVDTIE